MGSSGIDNSTPEVIMRRLDIAAIALIAFVQISYAAEASKRAQDIHNPPGVYVVDPADDFGPWQGWGSSLSWWARAVGGTQNADYYADLIYTLNERDGLPSLGLNVVRYNVGGGGMNQPQENKGSKLQWQMDIHGYWTDPKNNDPISWNWSADENQRAMMQKARDRGADLFEMFSDSPMWWMNSIRAKN